MKPWAAMACSAAAWLVLFLAWGRPAALPLALAGLAVVLSGVARSRFGGAWWEGAMWAACAACWALAKPPSLGSLRWAAAPLAFAFLAVALHPPRRIGVTASLVVVGSGAIASLLLAGPAWASARQAIAVQDAQSVEGAVLRLAAVAAVLAVAGWTLAELRIRSGPADR